ncbi:hypothetical protein CSUI_004739 [Cystoisospora suis]|uniref:Uncharacterized protein n=1 Tax=Cystoisospora suis TaxID=483139 RepID=A0A2C6L0G3_9APIC|nr:hypothetical protein CSUI_004739 [Cystoisospora suis]
MGRQDRARRQTTPKRTGTFKSGFGGTARPASKPFLWLVGLHRNVAPRQAVGQGNTRFLVSLLLAEAAVPITRRVDTVQCINPSEKVTVFSVLQKCGPEIAASCVL